MTRSTKRDQTSSIQGENSAKECRTNSLSSTTRVNVGSMKISASTLVDESSNTAQYYLYEPLDTANAKAVATRLVRILPELSTNGQIQCELLPFDLNITPRLINRLQDGRMLTPRPWDNYVATWTHTRYRAPSYLWVPEGDNQIILMNGSQHRLRRNL